MTAVTTPNEALASCEPAYNHCKEAHTEPNTRAQWTMPDAPAQEQSLGDSKYISPV
ncbi:hypothetical protein FRC12_014085, partial [Ceratobasidium sp. 428]